MEVGQLNWELAEGEISETDKNHIKILVMGAMGVGKTSLCLTALNKQFPMDYTPTILDVSVAKIVGTNQIISLSLHDTAGRGDYFELRRLNYPNTRVILMCYSVVSEDTLNMVATEYVPEFKKFMPYVPVILVGCKSDLKHDKETLERLAERKRSVVTKQQSEEVAKHFGFVASMQCSALQNEGVEEVIRKAIEIGAKKKRVGTQNQGDCGVM